MGSRSNEKEGPEDHVGEDIPGPGRGRVKKREGYRVKGSRPSKKDSEGSVGLRPGKEERYTRVEVGRQIQINKRIPERLRW